ncbi:uncharacterized protein BX664DRAFT_279085 [Halteromyces radiatus]|uniref:uncharacterized protein n=1 Tax=Halteromyces radiatus TaxID=101107 RepID=UPI00221E504F|nr:uncharacterized protein BX664DRAFT_279085 [Halteromyces radiatus]KAI8093898.1 hypothetical protein BX664DRAFT_279085 [Halteromyces radiatus]
MADKTKVSMENEKSIQEEEKLTTTEITEKPSSIDTQQQLTNDNNNNNKVSSTETIDNVDKSNSPPQSPQNSVSASLEKQPSSDKTNGSVEKQNENTSPTTTEPPAPAPVHPLVAQLRSQLYQRRHVLDNLEVERSQYKIDSQSMQERLEQMKVKIQQRSEAQQQLETNYREHLQSMRATMDDLDSISSKLKQLKKLIRELADELLEQADPVTATRALRTFWLNLHDCIESMGSPLPLHRMRMLTEKFMMDVLVQNMNLNVFPGLTSLSDDYNDMAFWFEKYDPAFSTRLRQEIALVMVKKNKTSGNEIHKRLHEAVQANWKFLYGGLIKAYPFVYQHDKHEPDTRKHYGAKVQVLVEHSMALGFAMKGQEVDVAAAETRERVQLFDEALMVDEDGQTSGVVDFCVCPPFVVYGSKVYTLEKGRVLCSPSTDNTKDIKEQYNKVDSPVTPITT